MLTTFNRLLLAVYLGGIAYWAWTRTGGSYATTFNAIGLTATAALLGWLARGRLRP